MTRHLPSDRGKKKHKSRKCRSSPSSGEEEEREQRKRRDRKDSRSSNRDDRGNEEEERRKKMRRKKKYNDRDKSKDKEGDSRERHSKDKEKSKRKDKGVGFKEISKDDYFSKNNEFATWMKETKGKYFSDLSSESARDLFEKFVKEWNKGKLPTQYYEGISTGPRSAHRFLYLRSYTEWSIQKGGASCSGSLYLPLMLVLLLAFAERS